MDSLKFFGTIRAIDPNTHDTQLELYRYQTTNHQIIITGMKFFSIYIYNPKQIYKKKK